MLSGQKVVTFLRNIFLKQMGSVLFLTSILTEFFISICMTVFHGNEILNFLTIEIILPIADDVRSGIGLKVF